VWGPGAAPVTADRGHPGASGRARRGQGGRRRRRAFDTAARHGGGARGRGGPRRPCQVGQKGGAGYGAPAPPCGGCPTRPPGGFIQGEGPAEQRRGTRWRAPASVQGPIKVGQTGDGRGGRSLPAVTVSPSLLESRAPPLSLPHRTRQAPSPPRVPTRARRPWHPRGRREWR